MFVVYNKLKYLTENVVPILDREEIAQKVTAINEALKQQSPALVIAAFYDLGRDLYKLFPGSGLDDILKEFKRQNINFYQAPLPNLEIVSYLISARENLAVRMNVENQNERDYFTAQLIGINSYIALIDTPEVGKGEESAVTKEFNRLGEVREVYQRIANENIELGEELLTTFKNNLDSAIEFRDERAFQSITHLLMPDRVEGLRGIDLEKLFLGKIPPTLLTLSSEDLEQIKAQMVPLFALKKHMQAQLESAPEAGKIAARAKHREINEFVNLIAGSLAKYYAGDRDITAFITLTEEMNTQIAKKQELIAGIGAQDLIMPIKKIGLDNKLEQITDLVASLEELKIEADNIALENPDRAKIMDFISNTKKAFCNYFEGNRTSQAQSKLRISVRSLVAEIEPVIERHDSMKPIFEIIGRKLRDVLTLGLYSYVTTGHYGFYKAKAGRIVDQIVCQTEKKLDENNNNEQAARN